MSEDNATRIQLGLIGAMAAAGLWVWYVLPPDALVPLHFNGRGVPDRWGPPGVGLLLIPAMALIIWALMRWLPRLDPKPGNLEVSAGAIRSIGLAVTLLLAAVQGLVVSSALGHGYSGGGWLLLLIGAFFVILGNVMGKLRANHSIGIRTPWTLADERVWDQTHRFGGKAFVLGGLVLLAVGLHPASAGKEAPLILAVTLGVAGITTLQSYRLWRARQGRL